MGVEGREGEDWEGGSRKEGGQEGEGREGREGLEVGHLAIVKFLSLLDNMKAIFGLFRRATVLCLLGQKDTYLTVIEKKQVGILDAVDWGEKRIKKRKKKTRKNEKKGEQNQTVNVSEIFPWKGGRMKGRDSF